MKIPHTFRTLLFAGLATVAQACSLGYYLTPHITPVFRGQENAEYHIDDVLDNQQVHFYETERNAHNILEVAAEGTIAVYRDLTDDFKVDEFCLLTPETEHCYSRQDGKEVSYAMLKQAQGRFDDYLQKIIDYNLKA